MPSKTEEYLALAQRTANGLTRYWESWTDYLTTASRLYKYPFADQLMIYAQRPDATACASFDLWNNRMNRYVRHGSKGIALLDQSSSVPRLHYVFDVSDTGVRRNSRDPEVWQLGPDLVQPVSEMLARECGKRAEGQFPQRSVHRNGWAAHHRGAHPPQRRQGSADPLQGVHGHDRGAGSPALCRAERLFRSADCWHQAPRQGGGRRCYFQGFPRSHQPGGIEPQL